MGRSRIRGMEKICRVCGKMKKIKQGAICSACFQRSWRNRNKSASKQKLNSNQVKVSEHIITELIKKTEDILKTLTGFLETNNKQIEIQSILSKTNNRCAYCGIEFLENDDVTIDHIFPLSIGGEGNEENLICCCRRCNSEKSNKPLTERMVKILNKVITKEGLKREVVDNVNEHIKNIGKYDEYGLILDENKNIKKV